MSITACSLETGQCLLSSLIENITNFKWVLCITGKVQSKGDIRAAWKMADKIWMSSWRKFLSEVKYQINLKNSIESSSSTTQCTWLLGGGERKGQCAAKRVLFQSQPLKINGKCKHQLTPPHYCNNKAKFPVVHLKSTVESLVGFWGMIWCRKHNFKMSSEV